MKYILLLLLILPTSLLTAQGFGNNRTKIMKKTSIQFEALKQAHWNDQELKNASIVAEFMQALMNEHRFEHVLKKFGHENYRQHNRSIPDGMEGLTSYIAGLTKRFPEYAYEVKYILASGDRVVFHSHMTFKKKHRGNEKKGFLVSDTWRLADGKIIEHWDALQALDTGTRLLHFLSGGKIRNSNGLF